MELLHYISVLITCFAIIFMAIIDPDDLQQRAKLLIIAVLYTGAAIAGTTSLIALWT